MYQGTGHNHTELCALFPQQTRVYNPTARMQLETSCVRMLPVLFKLLLNKRPLLLAEGRDVFL